MKDSELRNKLSDLIELKARHSKSFPKIYTAKELAQEVGGSATRVGHVAKLVRQDITHLGMNIEYKKNGNAFIFVITK